MLLALACFFALAYAQAPIISDRDIQRHLKAAGYLNGRVDGIYGRGSHAAFHKWALDKYGTEYLNAVEENKLAGKGLHAIRHHEMFHSYWRDHPLPPHIPSSWSWSKGSNMRKAVALSYDDGPHKTRTPRLLDILAKYGAKATFYVQGQYLTESTRHIVDRMVAEGHEVACHSWDHPQLSRCSDEELEKQVGDTNKRIEEFTGVQPVTIRPPYGATNPVLNKNFYEKWGVKCVLWSVDPEDWKDRSPAAIADDWIDGARPGAILLAHDIHERTIESMEAALAGIKEKGLEMLTVKDLLQFK